MGAAPLMGLSVQPQAQPLPPRQWGWVWSEGPGGPGGAMPCMARVSASLSPQLALGLPAA